MKSSNHQQQQTAYIPTPQLRGRSAGIPRPHSGQNQLDFQKMQDQASIKCRELQSCLAYLQDNGRLHQLHDLLTHIFTDERNAMAAQQQQDKVIDTTEILRTNLKEILAMMVDEIWDSQKQPAVVERPASIYQALLQSASQPLEDDSAYLGS